MPLLTELEEFLRTVSTKISPLTGLAERDLQVASTGEGKRRGKFNLDA
jgi:hypothetical protein